MRTAAPEPSGTGAAVRRRGPSARSSPTVPTPERVLGALPSLVLLGAALVRHTADEPTAALDARAEHAFSSSLHAHAGRTGAAVVLITLRTADHIVVLDRGRVVEQGGHADLLAADGLYRELWELQASAYRFAEEGEPAA